MSISTNIMDVTKVTISSPQPLSKHKDTVTRDIFITTEEGESYSITAFSSDKAVIALEVLG